MKTADWVRSDVECFGLNTSSKMEIKYSYYPFKPNCSKTETIYNMIKAQTQTEEPKPKITPFFPKSTDYQYSQWIHLPII